MNQIGTYRVVDTKRLLIPRDQESSLEFVDGTERINLKLVFESDADEKATAAIRVEGKSDHARIVFRNWRGSLGQSTVDPIPIGETDKKEAISFMAASWRIGNTRIIEVQIMIGGAS